jgi:hypothetical protein
LQGRFQEIFPAEVRRTILGQNPKAVSCNYAGIMYGDGVLWIVKRDSGYGITSVNVPTSGSSPESAGYHVEFACQTHTDRIIVDQLKGETLRYRAWRKPHALVDKPDVETIHGKKEFRGIGPCAYPLWSFTDGATKVVVEGLGCSNGDQPENAVGTIETNDKQADSGWCF